MATLLNPDAIPEGSITPDKLTEEYATKTELASLESQLGDIEQTLKIING